MDDESAVGSAVYDELLNICVWNKSNAGMGSLYRSKHEMVFVYRVKGGPHYNAVELGRHGRYRTNAWDYAAVNSLKGARRQDLAMHPTSSRWHWLLTRCAMSLAKARLCLISS